MLNSRFQKLQTDFEAQLIACDQLNSENQSKAGELKVRISMQILPNSILYFRHNVDHSTYVTTLIVNTLGT